MIQTVDQIKEEKRLLDLLNSYIISVGVIQKDSKRKEVMSIGITNAELMFIHENGSPMRNLPARPVLEMTIEWARENLDEVLDEAITGILDGWTETLLTQHLKRFCSRMESYARDVIYSNDGRLSPNAPGLIAQNKKWNEAKKKPKKKAENHPLFDTGQLARSITVELIKET